MLNFNKIIIIMGMTILSIMAVSTAQAEQCQLIAAVDSTAANQSIIENSKLFRSAQFQQLEANLENSYRKNINAEGGGFLMNFHLANMMKDITEEKLIFMYVDQYPKSFFAQLSAGIYYINKGDVARGTKFISETSSKQLDDMSKFYNMAIPYIQKAIPLNPRSALPHGHMTDIAGRQNDAAGKNVQEWLQIANQVDPKNIYARNEAIHYLTPRWGGTFELLDQIVQQAKSSLSAQGIRYLKFRVMMERASHEEQVNKDRAKAHELFQQAKSICENAISADGGIARTSQPQGDN